MNNETVNQEQNTAAPQQERTFTQAELNAIVSDRLNREREKYVGYEELKAKAEKFDAAEEAAKSDLQKAQELAAQYKAQAEALQKEAQTRTVRDKVSAETGVPVTLLTGTTEEECKAQAAQLLGWRGEQPKYPVVKDPGETPRGGSGKTRDQFANWFNDSLKK